MILGKIKIWFKILPIVVLLIPMKIYSEEPDDIQYKFTQTDSSYIFYGSFKINANPKCLLEILFNFEHIRALALDAKEIQLIDQGNDWNQISYIYQEFTFLVTIQHQQITN